VQTQNTVLPLSHEPLACWQLIRQLEVAGVQSEMRMTDKQTGHVLRRYRLGECMEDCDQQHNFSA
jgi:hypothetical protein